MLQNSQLELLTERWAPILDSGNGLTDQTVRETTAILLENQARNIITEKAKAGSLNESTSVGQLGTFQKFAFPIIRRVFPELMANKICGVQPMQGPVSQVFYLGFDRAKTTDAGVRSAETVYSKFNLTYKGMFPGDGTYDGSNIGSIDVSTTLHASSVTGAGDFAPSNTVGGNIAMFPDTTDLLQYVTSAGENLGKRSLSGIDVVQQHGHIPELDFHIETQSVEAGTRKFRALWTIEAAQDLKAYHNLDLERELTDLLSKEIELEIDRELIEDLRMIAYDVSTGAGGFGGFNRKNLSLPGANNFTGLYKGGGAIGTGSYEYAQPGTMPGNPAGSDKNVFFVDFTSSDMPASPQHAGHVYSNILAALNFMSNDIYKTTLRGPGNWFICSPLVAAMLESASKLEGGIEQGSYSGGVAFKGKFAGKYDMYVDPLFPEDEILMGYKGSGPMDAGFIYAPYIPLQLLPTVTDPDSFQPRKGIITRYGKVAIAPESRYYRILRIVGASASKYLYTPFARSSTAFGSL